MRPDFPYEKLPGRLRGVLRCGSLWLGADHVLVVDSFRFSEEYRRFYFRDVQAIVLRKCVRFVVPAWWLLGFLSAGIAALIGLAGKHWLTTAGNTVMVGMALYLGGMSVFGSCRVHIKTAVSWAALPSLYRMGPARRAVAILTDKIAALQGAMPESWESPVEAEPAAPMPGVDFVKQSGNPLWLAFAAFLALLVHGSIAFALAGAAARRVGQGSQWMLLLVALGLMFAACVQARGRAWQPVRVFLICAICLVGFENYVSYGVTSFMAAMKAQGSSSRLNLDIAEQPRESWQYRMDAVADLLIAIAGVTVTAATRSRRQQPAPE